MVGDLLAPGGFGARHYAPSDSRLLTNLIKAERTYIGHLHASVSSAQGASSALSSWGTSETPDVAEASARLADLLAACADVQSTHVAAIEGYRAALKDVADREASIRTVVRDRDILVSRLIKASQKSGSASSKKSPEERAEKVAKAQRELASCEEVLAHEEAALVGVKRRTFKEALTMRMKTMGDAGAAMVDAAKEAIILLDAFDSSADLPRSPAGYNDGFGGHEYQDYSNAYNHHTEGMYHGDGYHQDNGANDARAYQNATEVPYGSDGMHYQEQDAIDHPSFENASVTPSQSASQIYQPRAGIRDSYSAPFTGITENGRDYYGGDGANEGGFGSVTDPQAHGGYGPSTALQNAGNESDSDDEDWREAFEGEGTTAHSGGGGMVGLPAPHQLGVNAGTNNFIAPHQYDNGNNLARPTQSELPQQRHASSHGPPPPPAKDQSRRPTSTSAGKSINAVQRDTAKSSKKKASRSTKADESRGEARQLNYVSMPPVPSAPRLDAGGVQMGAIPSAPKLYLPGASGDVDSSSDEGNADVRGARGAWNSRINTAPQHDGASSDGERTARQGARSSPSAQRKGFLGRVGSLFKSPLSDAAPSVEYNHSEERSYPRLSSSDWHTRTESNLRKNKSNKDPGSVSRRQSVLSGPLVRPDDDSSDDEGLPDPKNLVRHVNKNPPLWQNKASSDLGSNSKLLQQVPRPGKLRRTPSASVTAGPKSYRASQEFSASQENAKPPASSNLASLHRSPTTSTVTGKAKKKQTKKSPDAGSEMGIDATRSRTSAEAHNSAFTVPGDASAGVRRSGSLNYGTMRGAAGSLGKRSSKRLSNMATQPVQSPGPKTGPMRPVDPQGKFATGSWIAKSNDVVDTPVTSAEKGAVHDRSAAQNAAGKPVATPTASNKAAPTTADKVAATDPAPTRQNSGPRHVPQPSATMSPPLKPALKVPGSSDLARSGSLNSNFSSAGGYKLPVLPAPVSAPPRASDVLAGQSASAAPVLPSGREPVAKSTQADKAQSALSLDEGMNFDGTGNLDISNYEADGHESTQNAHTRNGTALPRIAMPESEPFRVDLEARRGSNTPLRDGAAQDTSVSMLMTPTEQKALQTFLSQQSGDSSNTKAPDSEAGSVTRSTVRRTTVGSGVLGPKNVRPPSIQQPEQQQGSARAEPRAEPQAPPHINAPAATTGAHQSPGKLSRSYSGDVGLSSDSSDDEDAALVGNHLQPAVLPVSQLTQAPQQQVAPSAGDSAHERTPEGSGVGSGLSRRKSVRMAPDVKFPTEAPAGASASQKPHHRPSQPASSGAHLSSRIAPPPPAPPRLQTSSATDRPVDLGSSRERTGWSTRIGLRSNDDSSSDEDEDQRTGGNNAYESARRSFGSASQTWSQAVGSE